VKINGEDVHARSINVDVRAGEPTRITIEISRAKMEPLFVTGYLIEDPEQAETSG
jgi:hypothetical protein